MSKFKAVKDGILSNPYRRVRAGENVTLKNVKVVGGNPVLGNGKPATWLVALEDYVPEPEKVTVPHMDKVPPRAAQTTEVPPAPSSEQYKQGMVNIQASEAVQDGKAESYMDAKSSFKEIKPGKFVGEAQHVPKDKEEKEGTGNQDVLG